MEKEVLKLDDSEFSIYKRWVKVNVGTHYALFDRKEAQELIDFLQKHLHEVRE